MKTHHQMSRLWLWVCLLLLSVFVACYEDEGESNKNSTSSIDLKFEFESCPDHSADELLEMAEEVLAKDRAQFAENYIAYFSCIGSKFMQKKYDYFDGKKQQNLFSYNSKLAKLGKRLFDEEYQPYFRKTAMDRLLSEAETGDYTAIFRLFIIYAFNYSQYKIEKYYNLIDSFPDKNIAASFVKGYSFCYGIYVKLNSRKCRKWEKWSKSLGQHNEDERQELVDANKNSLFKKAMLIIPSVRGVGERE